jgi:toxin ParE1/3/4
VIREIRRRPRARQDVVGHFEYIAEANIGAADRYLGAVEKAYLRLLEMPALGVAIEHSADHLAGVRRWGVPGFDNYLIFYRQVTTGIEVVRVLHGARDLEAILWDEAFELPPAD